MGRIGIVFALVLGGCRFIVSGFDVPASVPDAGPSVRDLGRDDLAGLAGADLSVSIDLATVDLSRSIDAAMPRDLSTACGQTNQPCCKMGPQCDVKNNLACNNDVCTECSAKGVACCMGAGKQGAAFCVGPYFCFNGTCE